MKKIAFTLALFAALLAGAQTPYIVLSGGSAAFPSGAYYPNSLPVSSGTIFTNSSAWWIQFYAEGGGTYDVLATTNLAGPSEALAGYYITNFPPPIPWGYSLTGYFSSPTPSPTFTFYNFTPPPPTPIFSTTVTNFFPLNGGSLAVKANGITTSNNVLLVMVNSNLVYASDPTQTPGALWQLRGTLGIDASNTLTVGLGMTGNGASGFAFNTVSNIVATNVTFSIQLASSPYDTNLTLSTLQLTGQQAVGGALPLYSWPPPAPTLFSLLTQTNTPTISDLANQPGAREWCSNGFVYVTGSTNGTTTYTLKVGP